MKANKLILAALFAVMAAVPVLAADSLEDILRRLVKEYNSEQRYDSYKLDSNYIPMHIDAQTLKRADMVKKYGNATVKAWEKDYKEDKAEWNNLIAAAKKEFAEQPAKEAAAAAAKVKAEEERQAAIAAANAKGVSAEDFVYDITRDGKGIVINRYRGLATIVNIPAVIEGFPVVALGSRSERYYDTDNRIQTGTFGAFEGRDITGVTIPDSVTGIAGSADGIGMFFDCTKLKSVTLPKNLKTIPHNMFHNCTSLETIALPAGLTTIGYAAFKDCTGLKELSLPDSLVTIDENAFQNCTSLINLQFPKNLKTISEKTFSGCTALESVIFNCSNIKLISGFSGLNSLKEVTINGNVETIDNFAFSGCKRLAKVTFNGTIKRIGCAAFEYCSSLQELTINGNISFIDSQGGDAPYNVFRGCPLRIVNIGSKVTSIDNVDAIINVGNLSIATKAALSKVRGAPRWWERGE